jgi:AcrR family transcriptional regulator
MAEKGTAGLSLRATVRQVGMTAPALYHYFASLDDLITALIADAFTGHATHVRTARDRAAADGQDEIGQMWSAIHAYRRWALDPPIDFQLIYGTELAAELRVQLFTYRKETPASQRLADATVESRRATIADHEMAYDSFVWIDQKWREVQQEKDGPYFDTVGVPAYLSAFVRMLPSTSQPQVGCGWLSSTQATMENTDILGFLAIPELYNKADALRAARLAFRQQAIAKRLRPRAANCRPKCRVRSLRCARGPVRAG